MSKVPMYSLDGVIIPGEGTRVMLRSVAFVPGGAKRQQLNTF